MKIGIYSDEGNLQTVYEEMNNPILVGTTVDFDGGSFSDLTDNHIFINDDVDVPMTLEEAKQLDQRSTLENLITEREGNERLKKDNEMNALAIMELAELIMKGMS